MRRFIEFSCIGLEVIRTLLVLRYMILDVDLFALLAELIRITLISLFFSFTSWHISTFLSVLLLFYKFYWPMTDTHSCVSHLISVFLFLHFIIFIHLAQQIALSVLECTQASASSGRLHLVFDYFGTPLHFGIVLRSNIRLSLWAVSLNILASVHLSYFHGHFQVFSEPLTVILCLKVVKASHYDQGCWVIKLVNLRDKSRPIISSAF